MDETQRAAYVFAMAVGGLMEAMGMQATNQERLANGHAIAYDDKDFERLVNQRGLHHNAILISLHGG